MKGILFGGQEIEVAPEIWEAGLQWDEHGEGKIAAHHSTVSFFHHKVAELAEPVVIDAGACVGNYSMAAALHPGTTVYAFEPNPRVFPLLQRQILLNDMESRIFAYPYGLWHREETKTLAFPSNLSRAGIATFGGHSRRDRWDRVEVSVRKLDSFAHLWPNGVHVIKLDVEGAEWYVLRGGRKVIKRYHPALFVEWVNTRLFHYTREQLVETLESWGYKNFREVGSLDLWITT